MKKVFFLLIIWLVCIHSVVAQNYFRAEYQLPNSETIADEKHVNTFDGGVAMLTRSGDSSGTISINLVKVDSVGNIMWTRRLQFGSAVDIKNIVQSPDSSLSFCVQVLVYPEDPYCLFTYSAAGNLLVQKKLTLPPSYSFSYSGYLLPRNDGSYYLCARVLNNTNLTQYCLVCALNDSFVVQWSNLILATNLNIHVFGMDTCNNGDPVIAGCRMLNVNVGDRYIVARLNKLNGSIIQASLFDPGGGTNAGSISRDAIGNFYVSGGSHVMKLDTACNLLWSMKFTNPSFLVFIYSSTLSIHNTPVVVGFLPASTFGFAFEIDTSGNLQWARSYPDLWFPLSVDCSSGTGYSLAAYTGTTVQCALMTFDTLGQGCNDFQLSLTATPDTVNVITLSGSFAVGVNDSTPNYIVSTPTITKVPGCSSVENIDEPESTELTVYPNPAFDQVNVTAKNRIEKAELTNILGEVVLTTEVCSNSFTLRVDGLMSGTYFLNCYTDAGLTNVPVIIAR